MTPEKYQAKLDKLWGLANGITAFGLAQAVALLITIGSSDDFQCNVAAAKELTLPLLAIGAMGYLSMVGLCHCSEKACWESLKEEGTPLDVSETTFVDRVYAGRMIFLSLMYILCFAVFADSSCPVVKIC